MIVPPRALRSPCSLSPSSYSLLLLVVILERHSSNQHWRETPVILSRSATSAGILHASLTLTMARMTGLLDGVKSDTDRTFDYLNGALALVLLYTAT